jgi:rubredoxin
LHPAASISTKRAELDGSATTIDRPAGITPEPLRKYLMKKWQCIVCGLIYNEADGWPDDGIAPGTRWEDVPEDWLCPDCGVGKMDFEMIEIAA